MSSESLTDQYARSSPSAPAECYRRRQLEVHAQSPPAVRLHRLLALAGRRWLHYHREALEAARGPSSHDPRMARLPRPATATLGAWRAASASPPAEPRLDRVDLAPFGEQAEPVPATTVAADRTLTSRCPDRPTEIEAPMIRTNRHVDGIDPRPLREPRFRPKAPWYARRGRALVHHARRARRPCRILGRTGGSCGLDPALAGAAPSRSSTM